MVLHLEMQPGWVIPALSHAGVAEGDFVNKDKQYLPGTSLHVKTGKLHDPHSTEKGSKILVLWTAHAATQEAHLGDFTIAKVAAATA